MIDGMTMTTSIDTTMVTTRDPKIFRQPNDAPEMGVEMCAKLEPLSETDAMRRMEACGPCVL